MRVIEGQITDAHLRKSQVFGLDPKSSGGLGKILKMWSAPPPLTLIKITWTVL